MNAMSHQPLSRVAQTSQSLQTKGSHTSVHDKYLSPSTAAFSFVPGYRLLSRSISVQECNTPTVLRPGVLCRLRLKTSYFGCPGRVAQEACSSQDEGQHEGQQGCTEG